VPYDEDLAHRVRAALGRQVVTERKMFGGLAFLVDGHMAVAAAGKGGLMVRVDPADAESLLQDPDVEPVEMRGRAMNGWLYAHAALLGDDDSLRRWVQRGVAFARSLPPKR